MVRKLSCLTFLVFINFSFANDWQALVAVTGMDANNTNAYHNSEKTASFFLTIKVLRSLIEDDSFMSCISMDRKLRIFLAREICVFYINQ